MSYPNVVEKNSYAAVWQQSIPKIAWATICLFVGIVIGYVIVIISALNGSLSYPVALLLCTYLAFASFTVAHDAGHGSIVSLGSKFKFLEDVIGWIASIPLLLVPYRFFQKIHDRHHAFTNDPDRDPDQYTFGHRWYHIVLNSLWIPFRYHLLSVTTLRHLPVIRATYASTIAYFALITGLLTILIQSGFWLEVICFALIPNIIAVFFLAMFFDFIPHHPHKSRDRYHDTRIYPGQFLNVLLLGQNYHLIHHMYPRLPWYTYQEVYARILPDLEAHDAPIEDIGGRIRPGFMTSPNTACLQKNGQSINGLLKVANIERLCSDAVSVSFEVSADPAERLKYRAGQYITVSKWLAGQQQTRCYSLCASPESGVLKIGVRHTDNGVMSGFINRELQQGNELIVQGPFGDFIYPPRRRDLDNQAEKLQIDTLVLIAGGSGITPILSILETALQHDKPASIHLIYACRNRESMMFFDQIERLKNDNSKRLTLRYVIANDTPEPIGIHGRIDSELLNSLLPNLSSGNNKPDTANTEYYLCGPEGLKNTVVETLKQRRVDMRHVHVEQFVASVTDAIGESFQIDIFGSDGEQQRCQVASNQTVLEVAISTGINMPHACGNGTCGSCKCHVETGVVQAIPDSTPGITAEETALGYTLACQCKPLSDVVIRL